MKQVVFSKNAGRMANSFLALLLLLMLVSCTKDDSQDAGIEYRIDETASGDSIYVEIPAFFSENENLQQSLHELEKETKKLRKIYEKAEKKGEFLDMRCYPAESDDFPQVTVVWCTIEKGTRLYDLVTLCADEKQGVSITCREALERTGLTGVELSLQVGELVQKSGMKGELSTTEMQGFRIDDGGSVSEIYMKVRMEVVNADTTVQEEHFFSFDPEKKALTKLSKKGFDIP